MRNRSIVTIAVLVLSFLPTGVSAATPYPGGTYEPPPPTYGTLVEEDRPIRVDDGTTLLADIVYPTDPATGRRASGTFPVLITQNIYGSGPRSAAATSVPGEYFVQRGYIFIELNVRGTGGSEGVNDLFGERSGLDGVFVSYWAANPANVPGSNGTVGLQGCSALGITQLNTLMRLGKLQREGRLDPKTNPIKAIIPNCLSGDIYRDTFFDNGIPSNIWAFFLAGPALGGVNLDEPGANLWAPETLVDTMSGGEMGYHREWYNERDRITLADDIARTEVPALLWVGWGEGGYIGAFELYAALQNASAKRAHLAPMDREQKKFDPRYQAIIGDWEHGGGSDDGIEIEWYDTWLKNVDTGLRNVNRPLHVKELPSAATPRWVNLDRYPVTMDATRYYLSGSALSPDAPAAPASSPLMWAPEPSVTFTLGRAFDRDMTLAGPSALTVWARSSNSNLQLFAQLEDVAPDGTATHITHASILASRKRLDPARSWTATNGMPLRPFPVLTHNEPIEPDEVVALDIPIQPTLWRLAAGHTLQLRLKTHAPQDLCALSTKIGASPAGCLWPRPMLESLLGGRYEILQGPAHPSSINVPLVPSDALPTASSGVTPTSGDVPLPQDWG